MSDRLALQIGGGAPMPAWFREMVDTQAPGYAAAGLTLRTLYLTEEERILDRLLPLVGSREGERPALVVNRALTISALDIAALAALLPEVQFLTVCHSSQTFLMEEWGGAARQELYLALARSMANVWYAVPHRGTAAVLRQVSDCPRVLWLPNWVDPVAGEPRAAVTGRPWQVSLVSSLRPMKAVGVQLLAAAACDLELELSVCMHSTDANHLTQLQGWLNTCRHLTARVLPWMGREQFLAFVAGMDLALQCSPTESENLVALEHMLRGVPVVGSSALVYLPRQAIPWNHDDPQAIAATLSAVASQYEKSSEAALACAQAHTTATREQFVRVLHEVTG